MGVAGTAERSSGRGLEAETGASIEALSATAELFSELMAEATEWDERLAGVIEREREIGMLEASVSDARALDVARTAALDERELTLADEQRRLEGQESRLASREALVATMEEELFERARDLEARAARLRWRWFVRIWSWRPRLASKKARVCEFFFVPSPFGYKLLEQTGVAITPEARLTGLLDEQTTYTVAKLAQLPFDGRWCAYLQVNECRRTENE